MINVVKGTHDVILDEAKRYSFIETILARVAECYGYKEFRTPIIESSDLFIRSVGDSSDIVRKEMYTFLDHGNRSITLRPEMTAGIIRSMVNNKLFAMQDFPVKAYYCGPNFRYERPQQGRYRQFNQFGVECAGVTSPIRDAEVISLGYNSLMMLGFKDVKLVINSLGDEETRKNYKEALKAYFEPLLPEMCEDCKERFELNILRILDCKVPHDQELVKNAPKIGDFLSDKAKEDFNAILYQLEKLKIPFEIDESLVRGLDYYTGVVFEFHYTPSLGKDYGAIGAGGHYGKLIGELGGPDVEGCGFAMGIERLASVMTDDNLFMNLDDSLDVYVMPMGGLANEEALKLAEQIRLNGYTCEVCHENKSLPQMFKKAERRKALYGVIIGEDELKKETVIIRNLESKEQIEVLRNYLIRALDNVFNNESDEEGPEYCDDEGCCGGNKEDGECCCGGHKEGGEGCCCKK